MGVNLAREADAAHEWLSADIDEPRVRVGECAMALNVRSVYVPKLLAKEAIAKFIVFFWHLRRRALIGVHELQEGQEVGPFLLHDRPGIVEEVPNGIANCKSIERSVGASFAAIAWWAAEEEQVARHRDTMSLGGLGASEERLELMRTFSLNRNNKMNFKIKWNYAD